MNRKEKQDLFIKYNWMNLGEDLYKDGHLLNEENPLNRLFDFSEDFLQDPQQYVAVLCGLVPEPEYIYFVCKHILNLELLPFQVLILHELWIKPFPMLIATRGGGKTWILSVYAILRTLLMPGRKVVVVGAAFRQAKYVLSYCETIWNNAPVLRDICGQSRSQGMSRDPDRWMLRVGTGSITGLPIGDGSKIRGERANDIIADEFSSITLEVFETVVQGFGAVSSDPAEQVKRRSANKARRQLGMINDLVDLDIVGNQSIISGTAYFDFNHFADYYKRYRSIIESTGRDKQLMDIFDGDIPEGFSWKDFLVFRIPQELLPKGFLDEKNVARSKATVHSGIYMMEYCACFSKDTQGFFKRSTIESCVCPIEISSGRVDFNPMLKGRPGFHYVFGIDPAADRDNFAITILEIHSDHLRLVYCWSTNIRRHREMLSKGLTKEENYYGFCARKVRDLMKRFYCIHIACDSQGGGTALEEILHDSDKIKEGEQAIWQIIEDDKEKDTDIKEGLHILEICNFAKADWTNAANHGLRNDMEHKFLLFPRFDTLLLETSSFQDERAILAGDTMRIYDTLEDCVMEIEELKNELTTITMSQTPSGRDKWDTPEIKLPGGRKGRLVKDRYSALLMANFAGHTLSRVDPGLDYSVIGQVATPGGKASDGQFYQGADWYVRGMGKGNIVKVVRR